MHRFLRALVLATCLYSFLLWLYIALLILVNHVHGPVPFISGIPLSFGVLGLIAFVTSFASMVAYLTFWSYALDRQP